MRTKITTKSDESRIAELTTSVVSNKMKGGQSQAHDTCG